MLFLVFSIFTLVFLGCCLDELFSRSLLGSCFVFERLLDTFSVILESRLSLLLFLFVDALWHTIKLSQVDLSVAKTRVHPHYVLGTLVLILTLDLAGCNRGSSLIAFGL